MQVTVSVVVEQSADQIGKCLVDLVTACKKALADGWQPMQDVPAIVIAATADLLPLVGAVGQVPGDLAESKAAFARGLLLRAGDLADVLSAK